MKCDSKTSEISIAESKSLGKIYAYARHASLPELEEALKNNINDINAKDHYGKTVFDYALMGYDESKDQKERNKSIAIMQLLVKYGANPRMPAKNGHIPIIVAAGKQDQKLMEVLLEKYPANINVVDKNGKTVLHAILNSQQRGLNLNFLEFILNHSSLGTNILNKKKYVNGATVTHWAATNNKKALTLLIQKGVDVNVQDVEGNTPLHYALGKTKFMAIREVHECVELLLKAGANPYVENNQKQRSIDWSRTKLAQYLPDERRKITRSMITYGKKQEEAAGLIKVVPAA